MWSSSESRCRLGRCTIPSLIACIAWPMALFRGAVDGLSCSPTIRQPRRTPQPELPLSWSNPQGEVLTAIGDDIWLAERPFYPRLPGLTTTDVGGKMAVVRLPGDEGALWVHSPVELTPDLKVALAALGHVKHIVTPNTEHQKYAPAWILAYPEAESYACPGLRESNPSGGWQKTIGCDASGRWTGDAPPSWGGAIDVCWMDSERGPFMGGKQFFSEVVFHHRPSRTLLVTDLWWNYPSSSSATLSGRAGNGRGQDDEATEVPTSTRLWKFGMDAIYRPFYNSFMQGDRSAFDARLDTILGWDWDRMVSCHGEPIAGPNAKRALARHLGR